MRVVAVPDKLRATLTAAQAADAIVAGARSAGADGEGHPVSDGGEGFLDVLGGANRTRTVTGPLGDVVEAGWRKIRNTAVIEMASASGLDLVGGPDGNDPMAASTFGTGELMASAIEAGCKRILVGVGGSATTDGGLGALRALEPTHRLRGLDIVVACDVDTTFEAAAEVFAPQKGASRAQVALLSRRLARLRQVYLEDHGVDVGELAGSGAGGGFAGGLAAVGGTLVSGFDLVADELGLAEIFEGADLVVTAEGALDEQSFAGKAVGGVVELAAELGVPVLAVVGEVTSGGPAGDAVPTELADAVEVVSLVERFGAEAAHQRPAELIAEVVAATVAERSSPRR